MIDPKARTVRLRHEPRGFLYELRGDDAAVDVVRVDQVTRAEEAYGSLYYLKGRWRARKGEDKQKMDALLLVARAWNYVPFLKTTQAAPPESTQSGGPFTSSSQPAPGSGTRIVEGTEPPSSAQLVRPRAHH